MSEIDELKKLVEIYIRNKRSLSKYYSICMGIFPELVRQFSYLSQIKNDQADFFVHVKESISNSPYKWSRGIFENCILQILSEQIDSNLENVLRPIPNTSIIPAFINEIENSLAEAEYYRAIKTDLPEFENMIAKLRNDSSDIRKMLLEISRSF